MKRHALNKPAMTDGYVHSYAADEQERLLQQAEHWRDELILAETTLALSAD